MINETHKICHSDSEISQILKLLKLFFLWIMFTMSLLNKICDFYDYIQLMYNADWDLNLSEKFKKLIIIKKFEITYNILSKILM